MVILNLKDGLGNQMFEYAYARWLQEQYNDKLALNRFFFRRKGRRSYSLYHFKLNNSVKLLNKWQENYWTFKFFVKLILNLKTGFFKWVFKRILPSGEESFRKLSSNGMYINMNTFAYYPFTKTKKRNKYIYGNFINQEYFQNMKGILKEELQVITEPSEENKQMLKKINSSNGVCVHIRRGDYLLKQWSSLQVCDFDYYNNAMNEIAKTVENPVFYIFSNTSDDLKWISENYKFDVNVEYVDLSNPDYEELRLMMACKHFVLSNSTFGWWAAYLSGNENSKIYFPDRWENK